MTEQMDGQMTLFDPDTWSGRTCREPSLQTAARTSESSSKKPQRLQTPKFLYLDLRRENGLTQEPLWEMGIVSLGESSMLNISECPSVAVESHLSQILEEKPHPKYSLSARACQGILNRAERRGKELPEMLKRALIRQSAFKNEQDVRGGVKASSSRTTEQEHSAHSTINRCYGISAYDSNSMKSSNPYSGVYEADTSRTLDNNGGNPACNQGGMAVVQSMGFRWRNREKSGSVGCAKEQAPTLGTDGNAAVYDARGNGSGDLAPTITGDHQDRVTDYTALCIGNGQMCNMSMKPIANSLDTMHDQQAVMAWGLDRAAYNQGKNAKYNFSVEQERIGAQVAKGPGAIATQSIVRRLTPMECERLQGYPDGWTDIGEWTDSKGKKHKDADSPRYKALGNSIALPCWRFILKGIYERTTEHTMASLFDGIGGFPLIWKEQGGTTRWVSEIEEFCIAVTKRRITWE